MIRDIEQVKAEEKASRNIVSTKTLDIADHDGYFTYTCLTGEYPSFYFTSRKEEDADPEMISQVRKKGTFCLFEVSSMATLHLALAAYLERKKHE